MRTYFCLSAMYSAWKISFQSVADFSWISSLCAIWSADLKETPTNIIMYMYMTGIGGIFLKAVSVEQKFWWGHAAGPPET